MQQQTQQTHCMLDAQTQQTRRGEHVWGNP